MPSIKILPQDYFLPGEASKMIKFLGTSHTEQLPDAWTKFLQQHRKKPQKEEVVLTRHQKLFGTYRDTSSEWMKWRNEVSSDVLSLESVEKECRSAMTYLGYVPLKTIQNVRNLSKPFVEDIDCDFFNCWSFLF